MLVFTLAARMCCRGDGSDYGIMFGSVEEEFGLFCAVTKKAACSPTTTRGADLLNTCLRNINTRVTRSFEAHFMSVIGKKGESKTLKWGRFTATN